MAAQSGDAPALIERILADFHAPHRRDLQAMAELGQRLRAAAGDAHGLAADLDTLQAELDGHMFKEEMRLFPMMEQGGNSLIRHLIADMSAEHARHNDFIEQLTLRLAAIELPAALADDLAKLRWTFSKFLADLHHHVQVEEEILFPAFAAP